VGSFIKFSKVLILLIFIGLSANFALNNQDPVAVDFGPFAKTVNIKLHVFAFIIFILGSLTASLYFMLDTLRKAVTLKKQARVIKKLEKDNSKEIRSSELSIKTIEPEMDQNSNPSVTINPE
jgi:uncharacterized membrane protein YciS (DUF1049 family)